MKRFFREIKYFFSDVATNWVKIKQAIDEGFSDPKNQKFPAYHLSRIAWVGLCRFIIWKN
ncbi:MAG: hypothetical protein COV79_04375 [Parcubacteria group bacterium CG11_big_fil_rev_8_21_14_0_20_41_14]|nr:MAG: hypothetical protein COV79_04375 [Parcubacteria group bacterium CG11_big_fil_rev_8_21_14_0_20_41_14]PIR57131.1 MAG: hypothetical protein COU72_02585 [Parcubacteria group bacterium CG10_big_fil_rev_8_21_14_0_10_41_35]